MNRQEVLWESPGIFMQEGQTATLKESILDQKFGIILVFFPYSDGQGKDYIWESHFVPKKMVELHSGKGFNFPLYADGNGAVLAEKYLYITDTKITGNASNSTNANNKKWVLRYVIGV